jgi:hypothetical protein
MKKIFNRDLGAGHRHGGTYLCSTQLATTANERLQHPGKRHDRRCPEGVYELMFERLTDEEAALRHRQALRQFLHIKKGHLPPVLRMINK